jgi:hypothetical protein
MYIVTWTQATGRSSSPGLKDRLLPGGRSSGTAVPAAFVNRALYSIFRSERRLLDWFDLPAGVSWATETSQPPDAGIRLSPGRFLAHAQSLSVT